MNTAFQGSYFSCKPNKTFKNEGKNIYFGSSALFCYYLSPVCFWRKILAHFSVHISQKSIYETCEKKEIIRTVTIIGWD